MEHTLLGTIRNPPYPIMPVRAKPYAHQKTAYEYALTRFGLDDEVSTWSCRAAHCEMHYACALLMEMGTGKTLTSIAVAGTMYRAKRVQKLLVVAPLSILGVWEAEFERYAGFMYTLTVLTGSTEKKAKQLQIMDITGMGLQVVVVNYESMWRLEKELLRWKPDMVIADEGHKIKSHNTKAARAMHRIGAKTPYRLLLTGTVITNKALDLFSQYKYLDPKILGHYYTAFRKEFFDSEGYGGYCWSLKPSMETELMQRVHSIAYRVTKAECLDLPETTDEVRHVDLEPTARRVYRNLVNDSWTALEKGQVTAANILTRLLRLMQLTGGYLTDDEGGKPQQLSSAKLDALEEILESAREEGAKLVVIARFVPEIEAICGLLARMHIGYALIKGGTHHRDDEVARFQNDPACTVFVGQIATAGLGITLTAASTMVFYSLDFSMANYEQAKARIHRVGQHSPCTYIHLLARNTVDDKVLRALRDKADLAKSLIDDYQAGTNPFQS